MTLTKTNGNGKTLPSLMSDFFTNDKFFSNRWLNQELETLPAVNIKETNDSFALEFAAPGFNKADFKINVDGELLTISAEKKEEKKEENERFSRQEFSYNSFSR